MAIGASWDNYGDGSVWILFMNINGTVKTFQKIDNKMGGFTGILDGNAHFGGSVTTQDYNGDNIPDIVVGAPGDDDGYTQAGAVWVLYLGPYPYDKDHDYMLDGWETRYGLNTSLNDASADPDNDGLTNAIEYKAGTHPKKTDTDDDGIPDGTEDKNHNGVLDSGETNPADADTDNDGMPDGWEVQYGLNPLVNDAEGDLDNDDFSNLKEYLKGTLPNDRRSRPKTGMPWLPLLLGD